MTPEQEKEFEYLLDQMEGNWRALKKARKDVLSFVKTLLQDLEEQGLSYKKLSRAEKDKLFDASSNEYIEYEKLIVENKV